MRRLHKVLAVTSLLVGFSTIALGASVPPAMQPNGKLEPLGPSLPVGVADDATGEHRILKSSDASGTDALWVVSAPGGSVTICDAGGDCVDVSEIVATFVATLKGIHTLAAGYFYALTANSMQRVSGDPANRDHIPNTTPIPYHGAFLHGYDVTATNWERVETDGVGNLATRISQDGTNFVDATHPLPISDDLSANAVSNPLWFQISQDGATAVGAANPLPISDDMAANTLANTIKVELSDGAAAFLDNTASPGYMRTQDGDSTVLQDVMDTTADGTSVALNAEVSAGACMAYNGATLDMLRNSATKALITNIENHPAAYDEANGWVNTKKAETGVNAPAKETTLAVAGVATTIFASRYVLNDVNFCLYYKNIDGASSLTDASIEVSPDGTLWIPLTWTTCDTLAPGVGCVYCVTGNAYAYIRGRATGNANPNEVDMESYYTTNKG